MRAMAAFVETLLVPSPVGIDIPTIRLAQRLKRLQFARLSKWSTAMARVAAIIVEPSVQGAAGMLTSLRISPALRLLRTVQEPCGFDEVAVGFGRSGDTMFAAKVLTCSPTSFVSQKV